MNSYVTETCLLIRHDACKPGFKAMKGGCRKMQQQGADVNNKKINYTKVSNAPISRKEEVEDKRRAFIEGEVGKAGRLVGAASGFAGGGVGAPLGAAAGWAVGDRSAKDLAIAREAHSNLSKQEAYQNASALGKAGAFWKESRNVRKKHKKIRRSRKSGNIKADACNALARIAMSLN